MLRAWPQFALASCYMSGTIAEPDHKRATALFLEAAELGHAMSMLNAGYALHQVRRRPPMAVPIVGTAKSRGGGM